MPQPLRFSEQRPPRAIWTIRRVGVGPAQPLRGQRAAFEPPTDVYETPEAYVVRMEIAGLRPEGLEVHLTRDGRLLAIAGHRDDPGAGSPRKYYTMEIECGEFARSFPLRQPVDAEAVSASYAEGFLEITLPKLPPRTPRRVPIE
ncbi:MAG: Hsp20/alpha crystallin family protein [candidate division WS1 bacterium]|jgi:HSP20 family protein|nr:Hsp20/alpha crystallin family protein [candidate division WS1 bacterium]